MKKKNDKSNFKSLQMTTMNNKTNDKSNFKKKTNNKGNIKNKNLNKKKRIKAEEEREILNHLNHHMM